MRNVILFILIFICSNSSFSQATRKKPGVSNKPTSEQIAAQKNEAMKDLNTEIANTEKQIAEAKAKHEDLETISQLEDQLAIMKKMTGVITNINTSTDPRPKQKSTIVYPKVKYVSPIIPITLAQPVKAPTESQATDRLLWYKGKKIDGHTIITAANMIVRYDKQQNRVIVKPDAKKDSGDIKLVLRLSKTESLKNSLAVKARQVKNSFMMYPEILKAYKEYDWIEKRLNELVRNTIELPSIAGMTAGISQDDNSRISGPFSDLPFEKKFTIGFEQAYQDFLQLMNNAPPPDVPVPPKRPNDLCLCDQQIRAAYEAQLKQWMSSFWQYENELIQRAEQLHRFLTDNNITDISQTPNVYSDLDQGLKLAVDRKDQKLKILLGNYGDDVHREEALVQAVIATEREKQKLGFGEVTSTFNHPNLFTNDEYFVKYIEHAMEGKDYNVVFDYSLYLSHEYHKQLFGGKVDFEEIKYFNWLKRLEAFNRFTLTIDLDFEHHYFTKEVEPRQISTGTITSVPLVVSLGRLGCRWQLFIHKTNYESDDEENFRIPFFVQSGLKKIRTERGWETYPYVGPKDMLMVFPSFRISFCQNTGKDSVLMDVLRYKQDAFNFPNANIQAAAPELVDMSLDPRGHYALDMLGYANLALITVENSKANVEQLMVLADEMQDVRNNNHLEEPTGNSLLDELQIEYNTNLQQHEKQKKLTDLSKVGQSVVLFDAHNNSDILIDEPANTAHTEMENISKLVRGILHVKVVHSPVPGWDPREKYF